METVGLNAVGISAICGFGGREDKTWSLPELACRNDADSKLYKVKRDKGKVLGSEWEGKENKKVREG